MQVGHATRSPATMRMHCAFAGTTAGDVGGRPGARSQNIENNPMQSSRRPPAQTKQFDTSGKSVTFFHYSEILHAPSPRNS